MQEDLAEIEGLTENRLQTLEASINYAYLRNRERYTVSQIFMLNRILVLTTNEKFFSANTSSFEALKDSGVLDRLQGTGPDGRYTIDLDDFEKKASDPRARLFLLCSPHNPTGRVWSSLA